MSKLTENFIAVNEGRLAKSEFLRQARQGFPGIVTQFNSYEDAINILRRKGLLSEEVVYQCKGDKFPLESIERGIRYELEEMGLWDIETPSVSEYKKAKQKAIDNLCSDPEYYLKKIAKGNYPQEKSDERDNKMREVSTKKNLQEGFGLHKDVDLTADPDAEKPVAQPKKKSVVSRDRTFDHNWSVDDYRVAYIVANYGKKGIEAVAQKCDMAGLSQTNTAVAIYLINCTDAALQLVLQGIRKYATNDYRDDKNRKEFLASYKMNNNFLSAFNSCSGKSLEDCVALINPENVGDNNADVSGLEKKIEAKRDKANLKGRQETKEKQALKNKLGVYVNKFKSYKIQARGNVELARKLARHDAHWTDEDEAKAKKWGLWNVNMLREVYDPAKRQAEKERRADPSNVEERIIGQLMTRINKATGKKYTRPEAKKVAARMMAKNEAYDPAKRREEKERRADPNNVAERIIGQLMTRINKATGKKYTRPEAKKVAARMMAKNETTLPSPEVTVLKESIAKVIKKVLSEAATSNLAQFSDQNASVQNVPAILNSLENIVTEIESFILKEQTKIQGVFDSIGNIKNEDNIPVGYKFVQPIMDAFKKDLEPVLQKISLDNIKMPQAPELGDMNPEGSEMEQPDPKQTLFTPQKPIAENKQPKKRYTK